MTNTLATATFMWISLLEITILIVGTCWAITRHRIYRWEIVFVLCFMVFTSLYNSPWLFTEIPPTHHTNRVLWDLSFLLVTSILIRHGLNPGLKWGKWWHLEVCDACVYTKQLKPIRNK